MQKFIKIKIHSLLNVLKMAFLHFWDPQNWFHVKSEWQKIPHLATLWNVQIWITVIIAYQKCARLRQRTCHGSLLVRISKICVIIPSLPDCHLLGLLCVDLTWFLNFFLMRSPPGKKNRQTNFEITHFEKNHFEPKGRRHHFTKFHNFLHIKEKKNIIPKYVNM